MGRRRAVRRELRVPRQPRALALYRRHAGGEKVDGGGVILPSPEGRGQKKLRRLFLLPRREVAVEALALVRHLNEQLAGREAHAVFLFQAAAEFDEFLRAYPIDPRQRAAGKRREAEAEDGADIGLAHVGEHLFLEA